MKKILKGILIVLLLLVVGFAGAFGLMIRGIQGDYKDIEPLKLETIADGSYQGKAGSFIISAELNVHVKDHKITAVEVVRQVCGSDYKALDTIGRIIDQQEAKVDVVSGATWSSKSIMAATYDALDEKQ